MARTKRTEDPDTGTALALPDRPALVQAYSDDAKLEAILARVEKEVKATVGDVSTAAGRKAIASLAFKVARSKTALDEVGKDITEDARKQIETVNAKRRDIRDRLDALKTWARQPLDDWEAAEAARIADLEDRLRDFSEDLPGLDDDSATIAQVIGEIEAIPVDDTWAEFKDRAAAAKKGTLNVLNDLLEKAKVREAERAELRRLQAEAAKREEEDRARREKEAAEKAEAERQARIAREKEEAVERERQRAAAEAERAAKAAAEAEERHKRELAEAKAREEAAAQRERDRIAAEQARAAAERRAREADQELRESLVEQTDSALQHIVGLGPDDALRAAEAIVAGRIPHVKVEM